MYSAGKDVRNVKTSGSADQVEEAKVAHPFVSIIIPSYNSGSLLNDTLQCCLKIKGPTVEILVVDDQSTDGTPERVERDYPSVRLYRLSENSGSGAAGRNLGISLAKGRYIKFLDHDDLLLPRGFRAECDEAERTNADIVMSRWGVVPIDAEGCFQRSGLKVFSPPDPSRLIEAVLNEDPIPFTSAVLYKRYFIQSELWDADASTIDDFDWFCRMATRAPRSTSVNTISYYWRLHPHSAQSREKQAGTLYHRYMSIRYNVYRKVEMELIRSGDLTPERKRLLANAYYKFMPFLAQGRSHEWRKLLDRIYELDPHFVVDAEREPDPMIRRFIKVFGLPSFLSTYGFFKRIANRSSISTGSILRRP